MEKIKSRKFWMAIVTGALIVANQGLDLNIPSDSVMSLAGVVATYLAAQGYTDGQQVKAK